jgi:lysophospholipase L1-like esterase
MAATSASEAGGSGRDSRRPVRTYVAIGDSFTAGAAEDEEPEDHATKLWADELAEALRAAAPEGELTYRNLAVARASAPEVAEDQIQPALELEPDLVTVFCGANDVLLSLRPDIDAFREALSEIFGSLREGVPEATIITATCPDLQFVPLHPRSRERVRQGMDAVSQVIRELADSYDVLCLDFANNPETGRRENYAGDGIHLSEEGRRRTAAAFAQALDEVVGVAIDRRQLELDSEEEG